MAHLIMIQDQKQTKIREEGEKEEEKVSVVGGFLIFKREPVPRSVTANV